MVAKNKQKKNQNNFFFVVVVVNECTNYLSNKIQKKKLISTWNKNQNGHKDIENNHQHQPLYISMATVDCKTASIYRKTKQKKKQKLITTGLI